MLRPSFVITSIIDGSETTEVVEAAWLGINKYRCNLSQLGVSEFPPTMIVTDDDRDIEIVRRTMTCDERGQVASATYTSGAAYEFTVMNK